MTTAHWQTFSPKQSILKGWDYTKKYFKTFILLLVLASIPSLIYLFFTVAVMYIPGATEIVIDPITNLSKQQPTEPRASAMAIIAILTAVIGNRLWLGLLKTSIMILQNKIPTPKDIIIPFIYFLRLVGSSIIMYIVSFLIVAIVVGGLRFITTFIFYTISTINESELLNTIKATVNYFLGLSLFLFMAYPLLRFSFARYFIVEGYGAIDSLKASWAITKSNVLNLIGFFILYVGIELLGVLAALIGLLRAIPVVMLAQTRIYTQLKKNLPHDIKPIAS